MKMRKAMIGVRQGPVRRRQCVAEFVDRLFPALYGAERTYELAGVYQ